MTITLMGLIRLTIAALGMGLAVSGQAAQPAGLSADKCLEELRVGVSDLIECYGEFETDPGAQAELSRQTFNLVQSAKCNGVIRFRRAALARALSENGVMDLDPQDLLCIVTTSGDSASQVPITLAPKVSFQGGKVSDVSLHILKIANLPEFVVAPIRAATESNSVRSQLTKALNAFLEQALADKNTQ